MAKKKKEELPDTPTVSGNQDMLASILADSLNKTFKDYDKVAYSLDGSEETPTDLNDWVSTGSPTLDLALSNRPNGGYPVGRLVEIVGWEACVTEDTIVEITVEEKNKTIAKKIKISEIKELLNSGKKVKIKTINNEYADVTDYIDKGILDTYKVTLINEYNTNVSMKHEFFTDAGWLNTSKILPNKHKILCEDNKYYTVKSIENIGKHKIVDITVNHDEHCYFGNGMLHHNSGKSLLASHALAETQKLGGLATYIDTENALNVDFLQAIGVDVSKKKFVYVQLETVEEIFEVMENIITKVRASNKKRLVTIVVDSVAGASTKAEIEGNYDKDGWSTGKAIIISKAMRKITNLIGKERILVIFTNQLRQKLGVSFGDASCVDPYTTKIKIRYKNN